MSRYITNPQDYNLESLSNLDWDIIELPLSFSVPKLQSWAKSIMENHKESNFLINEEYENLYNIDNIEYKRRWYCQNPHIDKGVPCHYWMLNWPIEKEGPLPFQFLANPNLFPEVYAKDFSADTAPFLSKYITDDFMELHNKIGKYMKWSRLFVIPEFSGLRTHIDQDWPVISRLHININTDKDDIWYFGWHAERKYHMSPGKAYLVNTAVPHSVINYGGADWVLVYGTPREDDLNELLKLK
jgi:hypothetical protein